VHANCIELIPTNVSPRPDGFDLIGPVQFVLRPETRFYIGFDRISRGMQIIRGMFLGEETFHIRTVLNSELALDWVWEFESSVMHNHFGRGPNNSEIGNHCRNLQGIALFNL